MSKKPGRCRTRWIVPCVAVVAVLLLPVAASAQTGTLFVEGNQVGIGIASPATLLHVFSSAGAAKILVQEGATTAAERVLYELENKGKVRFAVRNTNNATTWTFDNDGAFNISKVGTGVNELRLTGAGDLFITGNLTENSDFYAKENIRPVDPRGVLAKVVDLPLTEWNYIDNSDGVRHLGPMAQDFHAAFGLGINDRGISPLDTNGVALAAIQGLHQLLEEKQDRLSELEVENAELSRRLGDLEAAIQALATEKSPTTAD